MFYSLLELFKRSHIFCIFRFFWIDPRYLSRIRKHPAYQCTLLAMVYRKMSSAPYLVAALFLYIEMDEIHTSVNMVSLRILLD